MGLGGIKLGKGHFRIGIEKGLLVHPAYAFERADIKGILGTEITRMGGVDLAVLALFFKGGHLGVGQDQPLLSRLGFQGFQPVFEICQIVAQPNTADLCPCMI